MERKKKIREYLVRFTGEIPISAENREEARIRVGKMKNIKSSRLTTKHTGEVVAAGIAINLGPLICIGFAIVYVILLLETFDRLRALAGDDVLMQSIVLAVVIALFILTVRLPKTISRFWDNSGPEGWE